MSSQVLWIVGGHLPLLEYRGPGQSVARQSSCPGSSWRCFHVLNRRTCCTRPWDCSVSNATLTIRKCLTGTYAANVVQQMLRYVRGWKLLVRWRPPCSDDPVSTVVIWVLVHGRADPYQDATGKATGGVREDGHRACWREVSAQVEVRPSRCF